MQLTTRESFTATSVLRISSVDIDGIARLIDWGYAAFFSDGVATPGITGTFRYSRPRPGRPRVSKRLLASKAKSQLRPMSNTLQPLLSVITR